MTTLAESVETAVLVALTGAGSAALTSALISAFTTGAAGVDDAGIGTPAEAASGLAASCFLTASLLTLT